MATSKAVRGVALLREKDSPYEKIEDGYDIARTIYDADINTMGGGWGRMVGTGAKNDTARYGLTDYSVRYDLVFYVVSGELEVTSAGQSTMAVPGEGILVAKGTVITLLGKPGTVFFYVLQPIDWAESFFRSLGPVADAFMQGASATGMTKQRLATDVAAILGHLEQKQGRDATVAALEKAISLKRFNFDDVRSIMDQMQDDRSGTVR